MTGSQFLLALIVTCSIGGSAAAADSKVSPYLVVDQFGYLPDSAKVAVIRSPRLGFDASEGSAFSPGPVYQLIDHTTGRVVLSKPPSPWQDGRTDPASGDRVWWFDFSAVQTPGSYYVLDPRSGLRSPRFKIDQQVYRDVLKQAVRTFFYQRAGMAKSPQHAGKGWADGASHLGPLQDGHCRRYNAKGDASTERDLQGGWYDAGDYNKYTQWTATYIVGLLKAYEAAPAAFGDDTNIPESGNGIPDVLDEVRWGMDWLERMQNSDGSVLSIVGLASASPPSAATGQSLYGDASTTATLAAAGAYAYGARVFKALDGKKFAAYANKLKSRAERAYAWADSNQHVLFRNNDASNGSLGLGGGQQETDDHGRLMFKLSSACYLFEITGTPRYKAFFEQNFAQVRLVTTSYADAFDEDQQEMLQHCAATVVSAPSAKQRIEHSFLAAAANAPRLSSFLGSGDAYMAGIATYTWGSNATKAAQGLVVLNASQPEQRSPSRGQLDAAQGYLHYLHGTNPLGLVYLSNMDGFGASNSVRSFFHLWFSADSQAWSRVGVSTYGPPPGFLTGGPNPSYHADSCCPSHCNWMPKATACDRAALTPPYGQPPAKSYKDFNQGWPLNSWEVTENSDGYQVRYIRLLSRFVH